MRVLEQICYFPQGFRDTQAHSPVAIRALLDPNCSLGTITAGCAFLGSLAARSFEKKLELRPAGAQVRRALQLRARREYASGTDAGRKEEKILHSWAEVLHDALADPPEEEEASEADSDEEYGSRNPSKTDRTQSKS